ncbi:hypothetical protein Tco_0452009, partial [Tanacetum coccineum]
LVPSCFVVFDLEPLALSFDFFEHKHVVTNPNSAGMRHLHLHFYMNPEIKQLAIKHVDEYGFVIHPDLVRLTSGSVVIDINKKTKTRQKPDKTEHGIGKNMENRSQRHLSKGANSLQAEDHNLWDVIINGDLEEEPTPTTGETSTPPTPKTAKQLTARRN